MTGQEKKEEKKKIKRSKPLNSSEIESAVHKIRTLFDDVIVGYMLSPKIKNNFEDRYLQALRSRVDIGSFLAAEMSALLRLKEEKEELRMIEENRGIAAAGTVVSRKKPVRGFADRILDELREKIDKYPGIGLTWEEAFDLDRLYGALRQFESEYWTTVIRVFRRIYPSRYSGPLVILEKQLFELAGYGGDGFPPRLYGYINMESRFPRNENLLYQEAMRCILDASFFLHDLKAAFHELLLEPDLDAKERKAVETSAAFVHTMIEDFRLNDLKRSKEK
jgi:hypothetical protein